MSKIKAPFTKEQVLALNAFQRGGLFHQYTCGGDVVEYVCGGDRVLIATEEGWICPCRKYKQDWAYEI